MKTTGLKKNAKRIWIALAAVAVALVLVIPMALSTARACGYQTVVLSLDPKSAQMTDRLIYTSVCDVAKKDPQEYADWMREEMDKPVVETTTFIKSAAIDREGRFSVEVPSSHLIYCFGLIRVHQGPDGVVLAAKLKSGKTIVKAVPLDMVAPIRLN